MPTTAIIVQRLIVSCSHLIVIAIVSRHNITMQPTLLRLVADTSLLLLVLLINIVQMLWFQLSSMHTPAWVETDSTSSLLCAVYYLTGLSVTVVFHACHSLNSSSRVLTSIMLTAVSLLSVLIRAIVHGRNTWTDSVSLLMQQRVTLSQVRCITSHRWVSTKHSLLC